MINKADRKAAGGGQVPNLLHDAVEQLSPDHVLQDHVVVGRILGVELINLDDVGVVKLAEDLHLTSRGKTNQMG